MPNIKTTQTLRELLFEAIDKVKRGEMSCGEARAISALAGNIVQSAELELRYSEVVSRLDKQDQGITPGPLLLTEDKK